MTTRRRIRADTPLAACPEKNVGLKLPAPISDRLDDLVRLAEVAGNRTNRKELVASLILASPALADQLSDMVIKFRGSAAGDARLDGRTGSSMIAIRSHPPGPRPRHQS